MQRHRPRGPSPATARARRCGLALLIACLLPCAAVAAHPGHLLFRSYGPSQGLPEIGIFHLLQDRAGFVWAATEDGLYRYDSHRFEVFGLLDGLPSVAITAIHEDPAGTLWVGTRAGLARWNGRSFDTVASTDGADLEISAIAGDAAGLWVATAQGLYRYVRNGGLEAVPDWPGGAATALSLEPGGDRLWVARWNDGASLLRREGTTWRSAALPADRGNERIGGLLTDGAGRVWARQATALLMAARGDGHFAAAQLPPALQPKLRAGVSHLVAGRQREPWVPVDSGVLHYINEQWEFVDTGSSLRIPWARAVLEDREGSLWVGSVGLHRLRRGGLFRAYTTAEGLSDNVVWCVLRDGAQRLWIGGAGLGELTDDGIRVVPGTEGHYIRSVVEGAGGTLYAAGAPGDVVFAYDPRRRALTRWPLAPFAANRILRLLRESDGRLWAATDEAGLLQAHEGGALQFLAVALPEGDAHEFVGDIALDGAGRLWAAGRSGLVVRDGDRWRRYTHRDGLRRDFVAYLRPTRDGHVLVGYSDPLGVARTRYADGRLAVEGHLQLPPTESGSRSLFLLAEDGQGRVWIGGGHGLDVLDHGGTWRHFGLADGLVGEDVNNMAFLAEADDVWIGTSAGLARFDLRRDRTMPLPLAPAPTFTALQFGRRMPRPDDTALELAPDENRFYARYAALTYADEDRRNYRARLVGVDPDFQVGDEREMRYPGLAPGHYRFEVGARIGSGPWSPTTAVEFDIRPDWWQSGWARAVAALCGLAVLLLALRWRMGALYRRNRALEACVATRTEELRRSNAALVGEIEVRHAAESALAASNAEERRRTERLALITRIAGLISSNLDLDTLLQRSADAVHEVLDYPNVDIPILDAAAPGTLIVRARGGWHKQAIRSVDRIPVATGIMGAAVRERRIQCVNDTAADARYLRPPNTPGSRAELAIPIVMTGHVYGVLNVEADRPFDELDVVSLGIVADYLAVAIENARLFEQAQDSAVKNERRRVAHDLHDNVTQILSSISMQAQTLAHCAGDGDFRRRADRLAELAQLASAEMREMLQQLRSAGAAQAQATDAAMQAPRREQSLPQALERLLRSMVPDTLVLEFDFAGYVPQQPEQEEALLRVVQEAVSNCVRHAGATKLRIVGAVTADRVRVSVTDDGRGFARRANPHGLGQESMRARMAAIGGTLIAAPAQPRGSVVQALAPRRDR